MDEKSCLDKANDNLAKSISRINRLTGVDQIEAQPIIDLVKDAMAAIKKAEDKINPKPQSKEKRIINLTPHDIDVIASDGTLKTIKPSGDYVRALTKEQVIDVIDGCRIVTNMYGEVSDLPEYDPNIYYIVSSSVAASCPGRIDLIVPGKKVIDAEHRVIGRKYLFSPNAQTLL